MMDKLLADVFQYWNIGGYTWNYQSRRADVSNARRWQERTWVPDVSNPTERVIDVLNFLAAHPTEAFTLAEIAKHLRLSNGSAHRVLTTMARAQFLSRNEKHKTYSLGAALVAIGQATVEKHRGIDVARRELSRLSVELNVQCSANVVVDGDLLVLVREGMPQSHLGLTQVGERRPFIPPWGLCHVAWSGDESIQTYLGRASEHLSKASRAHLLAAFALIRRRGFAIASRGPSTSEARRNTVSPVGRARDEAYLAAISKMVGQLSLKELQLLDVSEVGSEGISYLAAPVFSPTGTVSLQLVISGIPKLLSAAKIERFAERLCASAALVTHETHGKRPAH
jgi:DNA-binding IclR family transcriptional regulator